MSNDSPGTVARRAVVRDRLLAPIGAIKELAEMLLKDARDRAHSELAADLEKIRTAAIRLQEMIAKVLDSERNGDEEGFRTRIRHDICQPLNQIIGLAELWCEEARDLPLLSFEPDLRKISQLAKEVLRHLDALVVGAAPLTAANSPPLDVAVPLLGPSGRLASPPGAVLVVDDNEVNRDILSRMLRPDGHAVALAEDGRRAIQMLHESSFDVVLLDVMMPEVNGFTVLQHLKADPALCNVPVIMASAFNDIDSIAHCIKMGAEDYLPKPINSVLLRARVSACLEKKYLRDREARHLRQIEDEQKRADNLLHVILPTEAVRKLKDTNTVRPRRHDGVAVLFADIVNFTPYCDGNEPETVVSHLQRLVEQWEEIALEHSVEKIKTIGDAFMGAAGLLRTTAEHPVLHCLQCGLAMIEAMRPLSTGWNLRVGIHFGSVVAGVIGRQRYSYDLWGDTVNTAARMESHGVPGAVTLSAEAWRHVSDRCNGTSLIVGVKGKGNMERFRFDGFRAV